MARPPRRAPTVLGVLAIVLLAGAACAEPSRVDPDAAVRVSGAIEDVDGSPLAGRPVRLGSGVTDLEGGAGVLTVGLFCLGGDCTGEVFTATTADDGTYALDLTGEDTRSAFGEAVPFLLSATGPPTGDHPAGPLVAARFRIQTADLRLPPLGLVDPGLDLAAPGATVAARWTPEPAPGPYTLGFADRDGYPVWEVTTAEAAARVDGRVLEDVVGQAAVTGTRSDRMEGSDLEITWRSPTVAFRGGLGAPPSRAAPCAVVAPDGTSEAVAPCPLTDGRFTRAGVPASVCPATAADTTDRTCPEADRVRIELASPVTADLVVVRGCADACRVRALPVEGGPVDGGPIAAGFGTVALDGAPVRGVEVVTPDVGDLAEVAVWPPAPDRAALLPADDPAELALPGDAGPVGERGGGLPWAALVAAVVALLAAAAGLGVVVGRRTVGRAEPAGGVRD